MNKIILNKLLLVYILCLISKTSFAETYNNEKVFHPFEPQSYVVEKTKNNYWLRKQIKKLKVILSGKNDDIEKKLISAANDGDIYAKWHLANLYHNGNKKLKIKINNMKAFHLYKDVGGHFSPDIWGVRFRNITLNSLVMVANYYRIGIRNKLKQNRSEAVRIYQIAANYGHPEAQYCLGIMYMQGDYLKKNNPKALQWLILSAKKNFTKSQNTLGDIFWKGNIVKKDQVRAFMWYILADKSAKQNNKISKKIEFISNQINNKQKIKAEKLANNWLKKNEHYIK